MSTYTIYGEKIIANDETMKEFARSIVARVDTSVIEGADEEYYKDEFMEIVATIITDDINRTDIKYEQLMYNYRFELGDLLYEMENHDCAISESLVHFFGKKAEESFCRLLYNYIEIHFSELVLTKVQKELINKFVESMIAADLGAGKELVINDKKIVAYKDEEYGNLFDIHTFKDQTFIIQDSRVVDDSYGIDVCDLQQRIVENIIETREFSLLKCKYYNMI